MGDAQDLCRKYNAKLLSKGDAGKKWVTDGMGGIKLVSLDGRIPPDQEQKAEDRLI